jgi:hypothetical protein
MRVSARIDRVEAQVVPVREQPGGRRLAGARRAADPENVFQRG